DSILIDEARTPLIISGPAGESTELYSLIDSLVPKLQRQKQAEGSGDYSVEEKSKQVYITEEGHQRVEELFAEAGLIKPGENLYDANNIILVHHLNAALRAHNLFHRDVDYIIQNGEAVIVDEHTGRTMPGRRWSDGLHQAVEAKEKLRIHQENQTLASITFQNYFRLYNKLAGMTGTADTEAYEFQQIYGLEVVVIPTHRAMVRNDQPDLVFINAQEKFTAIVNDIKSTHKTGQPILVGTTSIETSEYLSRLLQKENIAHQVLNAKYHEKEAHIIAEAGRPGAVTIATNMAGRGTDIVLGGNLKSELKSVENITESEIAERTKAWQEKHDQVVKAGGLYVLGTERHESRRIDNQLRGRSGRQGDPGKSRFYLSLEDNLLRIFGGERLRNMMQRIGVEEGMALESRLLSRSIENAQRKVEAYNFDVRKQLLEYDDVANEQRKVIYKQRDDLLTSDNIAETIDAMRMRVVESVVDTYFPAQSFEDQWDIPGLETRLESDLGIKLPIQSWLKGEETIDEEMLRQRIYTALKEAYDLKEAKTESNVMRQFEKAVTLQTVDKCWREHLAAMDYLRQGIHLRGYAQKNPKQEYKRESFELFAQMLDKINYEVISLLSKFEVQIEEDVNGLEQKQRQRAIGNEVKYQHAGMDALHDLDTAVAEQPDNVISLQKPIIRDERKVGRNEACPCGSGKKYKHCHGTLT
ncbi:MAG TPA: preprotein translocase subunit SecA, partial [Gammaproteobacteria bacterium]|nr:preprotein translocase subunit SecA [Gammaproteobacteria bacterium]